MNLKLHEGALHLPALVSSTGERAAVRFLDFFTSNIRNPNTRKAYARGLGEFLACAELGSGRWHLQSPRFITLNFPLATDRGARIYYLLTS